MLFIKDSAAEEGAWGLMVYSGLLVLREMILQMLKLLRGRSRG